MDFRVRGEFASMKAIGDVSMSNILPMALGVCRMSEKSPRAMGDDATSD